MILQKINLSLGAESLFFVSGLLIVLLLAWNKVLRSRVADKTRHLERQVAENQVLIEAMARREKLRQDIFLSLSHELRTPLHVILSALQLYEESQGTPDSQASAEMPGRICQVVRSNSYRLLRVISNLIDMNRIEVGQICREPAAVDIGQGARQIYETVKPWFQKKGVRLSYEEADDSLVTRCDPAHLERVLLNVLSNALKFTPAGGDVLMTAVRNRVSGDIVLSVKDTGPGIPETELDRVFEKYLQLDRDLTRSAEGNGLGLAIVKGLVQLEGGTVQAVSAPGKGAEIRVRYPADGKGGAAAGSGIVHRETLQYRAEMEFSEIIQE